MTDQLAQALRELIVSAQRHYDQPDAYHQDATDGRRKADARFLLRAKSALSAHDRAQSAEPAPNPITMLELAHSELQYWEARDEEDEPMCVRAALDYINEALAVLRASAEPAQSVALVVPDTKDGKCRSVAGPKMCDHLKCTYEGMDGERYRCDVCGRSYFLDYEDMK